MKLLYGKNVADKILERLKGSISGYEKKPGLAVILIGSDKASQIYVTLKEKKAQEIGMIFFKFELPEVVAESKVLELIDKLNVDENVHGIIVQLPLPDGFNTLKIIEAIDHKKDVDGFHSTNSKLFLEGKKGILPVFPRAIMQLIESIGENLHRKKGIIIANSDDFGKIMSAMLENAGIIAQYVLVENISLNLEQIKDADIVISAVGLPGLLRGEMLKSGSIMIDGGITKIGDKVLGDVDFSSTELLAGHITPVPGGVGPMTIACLLENTHLAFEAQEKEKNS